MTEVAPGDFVILNWRAVCGQCRSCRRGRPWYCFATRNATQKMTLLDGSSASSTAASKQAPTMTKPPHGQTQQMRALSAVAKEVAAPGDLDRARQLAASAETIARTITIPHWQAEARSSL